MPHPGSPSASKSGSNQRMEKVEEMEQRLNRKIKGPLSGPPLAQVENLDFVGKGRTQRG